MQATFTSAVRGPTPEIVRMRWIRESFLPNASSSFIEAMRASLWASSLSVLGLTLDPAKLGKRIGKRHRWWSRREF